MLFDCWNLGKAIIWSKGAIVNNYTVVHYAAMDTSCGLGDWGGNTVSVVLDVVTVEDQAETVIPTVTGKSFSLSFEDEILVNFYYAVSDLSSVVEHGMLMFKNQPASVTADGADVVYNDPAYNTANSLYVVTTDGIAAKQLDGSGLYRYRWQPLLHRCGGLFSQPLLPEQCQGRQGYAGAGSQHRHVRLLRKPVL